MIVTALNIGYQKALTFGLNTTWYENLIAGAAIDVFEMEPCDDFVFLQLPNLYCTPHTGGSSEQSMLAMGRSAIDHLKKYFGL